MSNQIVPTSKRMYETKRTFIGTEEEANKYINILERHYILDIFSYQKSFCIPKDKSDSYQIKYQTKWYIKNFTGIENLIIENKNLKLDYQRLLNDDIFYNQSLEYEIVEECPKDKPYVIYSTRQCVSSCYSNNLIEFGIFMIKIW